MKFRKQNKQYISTAMKIGIPSIIELFFVCLAGLIDSLMVSSLGAEAVATVGITSDGITKYTCSYFRFKSDKWVNIKI